jgi:hypothetical protein
VEQAFSPFSGPLVVVLQGRVAMGLHLFRLHSFHRRLAVSPRQVALSPEDCGGELRTIRDDPLATSFHRYTPDGAVPRTGFS